MYKSIHRPCRTNRITQGYYDNDACVKNNKIVVCRPGLQSFYHWIGMNSHGAIDLSLWHGEHLYFPADFGIRWRIDPLGAFRDDRGLTLQVISEEKLVVVRKDEKVEAIRKPRKGEEGNYVKFIFGHMMETPHDGGDTIRFGQYLGRGDNSGYSTGDHVHFSFKECDKNGKGLNTDNGWRGNLYFGALYSGKYIVDVDETVSEMHLTVVELLKKYKKLLQVVIQNHVKK